MSMGKGIQLSTGFDLNAKAPLDNRELFNSIKERDSLPDINLYDGLKCFVKETQKNYQYLNGAWSEWGNESSDGGSNEFEIEVNGELTDDYTLSVNTNEVADAYKSVYDNLYSQFQMMFSQMQKIIDTQQKKINNLEARVFALENKIGESDKDDKSKYVVDYNNEPLVDYNGEKIDNYGKVTPISGIVDYKGQFLVDYNGEAILNYKKVTVDTKNHIVDYNGNALVDYNDDTIKNLDKTIKDYSSNTLEDYDKTPVTDYGNVIYLVDYQQNNIIDYNNNNNIYIKEDVI